MKKNAKDLPFEEGMNRLQEIVNLLESGTQPLEQGVTLYKEGATLAQLCRSQLEKAQHEIMQVSAGGLVPFLAENSTTENEEDSEVEF